jgi:hypothetical protein
MAVPEDATDVFAMDFRFSSEAQALNPEHQYYSGFPVDMHLNLRRSGGGVYAYSRLQGGSNFLRTSTTDAEVSSTTNQFGSNEGLYPLGSTNTEDTTTLGHMFRRAPNFFDVVAYTGGGYNTNVKHNLGVTPELCIAKSRTTNSVVDDWYVWCSHSGDGNDTVGFLNSSGTSALGFHASSPSSTDLYLHGNVAYSGYPYIMYLFASLDGVSKVGSFTYAGTTLNVDCGFSAGARFVLYKRYNTTGSWLVLDSERGINASANDPVLYLNATDAEDSGYNLIEPYSAGFTITGNDVGNGDYIFYAIA